MARKKYQKKFDCDMQSLLAMLDTEEQRAFVCGLRAGDGHATAYLGQCRAGLTKPRRVCMELFLSEGIAFDDIAERTGYLIDDIPVHIVAGVTQCVPVQADMQSGAEDAQIIVEDDQNEASQNYTSSSTTAINRDVRTHTTRKGTLLWWLLTASIVIAGVSIYMLYGGKETPAPASVDVKPAAEAPAPEHIITEEPVQENLVEEITTNEEHLPDIVTTTTIRASIVSISREESGEYTSEPLIGRQQYDEYLANAVMPLSKESRGEVIMTFTVNRYGHPSGIRVVSILTHEANQEAIRLLANGPEWAESARQVTLTIQFL